MDGLTAASLADLFGVSTRTIRDLATGRGGEAAITMATAERARLARAQAEHVELENARQRGALVECEAVERE